MYVCMSQEKNAYYDVTLICYLSILPHTNFYSLHTAQVACVSVFYDEDKRAKVVVWDKPVGEVTVYSVRISYNDGSSGQLISQYSSSRNQWLEQRLTDLPIQRPLWIEVSDFFEI